MSRSFKKTPIIQDGYGSKTLQWYKRQANKKVRRTKELASRKAYRKVYETWIFRDYFFRQTLNQYKLEFESDLKHCLIVYGSVNNLSWRSERYYSDKHFKLWRKYYFWK